MKKQMVQHTDGQLPEEMLVELGRMVASWTALDDLLVEALERLAGMDKYMDAHSESGFRKASFSRRLQVFGAYCGQLALEFSWLKPYRDVMEKLKTAHTAHNRYVRSRILFNPETRQYEMPFLAFPDDPAATPEKVCIEILQREACTIAEAHDSLCALVFHPGLTVGVARSIGT